MFIYIYAYVLLFISYTRRARVPQSIGFIQIEMHLSGYVLFIFLFLSAPAATVCSIAASCQSARLYKIMYIYTGVYRYTCINRCHPLGPPLQSRAKGKSPYRVVRVSRFCPTQSCSNDTATAGKSTRNNNVFFFSYSSSCFFIYFF